MGLLLFYISIALGFSFLCSIAEAVLLSVTPAYVRLLEQQGKPAGGLLATLKADINKPLAAILTLNTIAHTAGAAGAGAQASVVFGSQSLGIVSAVLTLLILIVSEIIPKTLGAHYWRGLAPAVAHMLRWLVWILYPFVKLSEWITGGMTEEQTLTGFSRSEIVAMADLSVAEGELAENEGAVVKNLLRLRDARVKSAMTPRIVLFSLAETTTVEEFFHKYDQTAFSRIPIYGDTTDQVSGFVLRNDLLLAQARGNSSKMLSDYRRELPVILGNMSLAHAFSELLRQRSQLFLVVDEYGGVEGLLTMEDILETLLGLEIVDERDKDEDMQHVARKLWKKRAERMGIDVEQLKRQREEGETE